jgi:predicted lipoprotein with Yx(FWY)xxD motif
MRRILALLVVPLLALGLASCGGDDDDDPTVGADSPTTTEAASPTTTGLYDNSTETTVTTEAAPDEGDGQAAEVVLTTGDTDLGTVLVDTEGYTLYFFDPDTADVAACTDACAQAWPPLSWLNDGTVGGDADPAMLGVADRDGAPSPQATYNGHRLYTYSGDSAPGDTTGNGVGDVWHAVTPAGEAVA